MNFSEINSLASLKAWGAETFQTSVTAEQFFIATLETFQMVGIALGIGLILATGIAITLYLTRSNGLKPNALIYNLLNGIVNVGRSLPFIILLVSIIPFTRFVVGTAIGTNAAIVPLTVFVAPYLARLIEAALLEVDDGILEAADAMGATTWQTITRFVLPEARASLVLALTTGTIGLIDATAMAGYVGGGGIGNLAITHGYNRFDSVAMLYTVIILVIIVQSIQMIGNMVARRLR